MPFPLQKDRKLADGSTATSPCQIEDARVIPSSSPPNVPIYTLGWMCILRSLITLAAELWTCTKALALSVFGLYILLINRLAISDPT